MKDLMIQTSSVLQTTPTCQHQYLETKNTWRNNLSWSKLNQFNRENLNLKLNQPFDLPNIFKAQPLDINEILFEDEDGEYFFSPPSSLAPSTPPATSTQSAGGGHTGLGTPVSTRTPPGFVLSNVQPALLIAPFRAPVKCQTSMPTKEPSSRRPSTPTMEMRISCLKPDK